MCENALSNARIGFSSAFESTAAHTRVLYFQKCSSGFFEISIQPVRLPTVHAVFVILNVAVVSFAVNFLRKCAACPRVFTHYYARSYNNFIVYHISKPLLFHILYYIIVVDRANRRKAIIRFDAFCAKISYILLTVSGLRVLSSWTVNLTAPDAQLRRFIWGVGVGPVVIAAS